MRTIVSCVAARISSRVYGMSIRYIPAERNSRSMWSAWRKIAVPRGVSYARMPSKTPVP